MTVKIFEYGKRQPVETTEERIHPMTSTEKISAFIYTWLGFAVREVVVNYDNREVEVRLRKGVRYA